MFENESLPTCGDHDATAIARRPDAPEDCPNGIDDDCDALVDYEDSNCPFWDDDDGDLFDDQACGRTDCGDAEPEVNPAATEAPFGEPVCSDDTDNDCDGDTDGSDLGCMGQIDPTWMTLTEVLRRSYGRSIS